MSGALLSGKFSEDLIFHGEYPGKFSVVGVLIPMPDYKYLRVAILIWATMINTQTHTDKLTSFERLYMTGSAS